MSYFKIHFNFELKMNIFFTEIREIKYKENIDRV